MSLTQIAHPDPVHGGGACNSCGRRATGLAAAHEGSPDPMGATLEVTYLEAARILRLLRARYLEQVDFFGSDSTAPGPDYWSARLTETADLINRISAARRDHR
jgi:hypothetical protein